MRMLQHPPPPVSGAGEGGGGNRWRLQLWRLQRRASWGRGPQLVGICVFGDLLGMSARPKAAGGIGKSLIKKGLLLICVVR